MSRLTHVKYLIVTALAFAGVIVACGSPSESPPMAPRPDPMTPRDPVPSGPGIPDETSSPGPTFPSPDGGPGQPEPIEPRNPVNPTPNPLPSSGGPLTVVVVPPATFGASGAEQMQLADAGVRDAAPRPDSAPRPDAPPPPDASPTRDALMPPPSNDAGRPTP